MKRIINLVLIGFLLIITACGAPSAPTTGKPQGNDKSSVQNTGNVKEIVIAGGVGKIEKLIRDEIGPKYTEKTGIKINYVAGLSGEIYAKLDIQKNAPQIDIAILTTNDTLRAVNSGLFEEVNDNDFPNLGNVDQTYRYKDIGIPIFGHSYGIAYNTKIFKEKGWEAPASWNDLARKEFKGRTAYVEVANDWGLTAFYNLALANGGSLDNVEPAIEKEKEMAAISDTFYKNSTQALPVIQQETAAVSILATYIVADLIDKDVPMKIVIPKEGAPLQAWTAGLVKNSPRMEAAKDFVNFILNEESQKAVANSGFYPVINGVEYPEKYQEAIGIKETDKVYTPDFEKIAEAREVWVERFAKEVVPELGKSMK